MKGIKLGLQYFILFCCFAAIYFNSDALLTSGASKCRLALLIIASAMTVVQVKCISAGAKSDPDDGITDIIG
jgi:hypothetical protein